MVWCVPHAQDGRCDSCTASKTTPKILRSLSSMARPLCCDSDSFARQQCPTLAHRRPFQQADSQSHGQVGCSSRVPQADLKFRASRVGAAAICKNSPISRSLHLSFFAPPSGEVAVERTTVVGRPGHKCLSAALPSRANLKPRGLPRYCLPCAQWAVAPGWCGRASVSLSSRPHALRAATFRFLAIYSATNTRPSGMRRTSATLSARATARTDPRRAVDLTRDEEPSTPPP